MATWNNLSMGQTNPEAAAILAANGYNIQFPNSYQSQLALQALQDYLTGNGANTTKANSFSGSTDATGQASYTGIVDSQVRNALTEKALADMLGNPERVEAKNKISQSFTDYSKGSAFADSRAAADYNIQKALEAFAPGMTRGMQAAGQSGGSMQALLTERAAMDAALTASLTQLQAAKDYGSIASSLANPLEAITRTDTQEEELALKAAELLKTSESQPVSTTNSQPGFNTPGAPTISTVGSSVGSSGASSTSPAPTGNWYFGYGNNLSNFKP